jgi:hypothetical protein
VHFTQFGRWRDRYSVAVVSQDALHVSGVDRPRIHRIPGGICLKRIVGASFTLPTGSFWGRHFEKKAIGLGFLGRNL